jgi:hypothetical protein
MDTRWRDAALANLQRPPRISQKQPRRRWKRCHCAIRHWCADIGIFQPSFCSCSRTGSHGMKKQAAFLTLFAFISGCATEPRNAEQWMTRERNACLPTAIAMSQGLQRQGITAKVVRYSYFSQGRHVGHAITAYIYPPGSNELFTYDHEGSWRTRAYLADPIGIAKAAERLRSRYNTIISAEFL